jgi:ABC-type Fe2+-enterobactin transport system substrate-binding protein
MSVEVKGTIKYDPDVKAGDAEYTIECKQLGICDGSNGNLELMIDELTKRVQKEVSEEFHIPPARVQVVKYSMALTFEIVAPQNKTLDLFLDIAQRKDGQKIVESAGAIMEIAKVTGKDPMQVFEEAKTKAGIKK